MKRRTVKKQRMRREHDLLRTHLRELDRHDRAYLFAFMRASIHVLARAGGVDDKIATLATIARRLAPSIMAERRRTPQAKDTER